MAPRESRCLSAHFNDSINSSWSVSLLQASGKRFFSLKFVKRLY